MKACPHCRSRRSPHLCKPTAAEAVEFFPTHLTHAKGRWAGQRLELDEWQKRDLIVPVFGRLVFDEELGIWVRQIRTVYVEIPRKNTKSTTGAGIALKLAAADGEKGAEVYSVAEDIDQAGIVFGVAKTMVEASEALSKRAKVYKRLIEFPKTGNIYRVLPGDASGSHGLNVHGLVFDELHTQKHRELWDVMTSAQGTRTQPLTVALTTAGTDRTSVCREQHDYGEQVKARIIQDPSFHYVRYGVPEGAPFDWEDEKVWRAVNPALGSAITMAYLRSEYRKAKASPARQNAFRNLYLNEWTQAITRFIDLAVWDESAGLVDESKLTGRSCYGALNLSHPQHIAAACWDFAEGDEHQVVWRFWLPKDKLVDLDEQTGGQATVWAREGHLTLTEGNVIDFPTIRMDVLADAKRFDVKEVAYNPLQMTQFATELQDEQLPVFEMGQTMNKLSPGTKEMERLVIAGRYRHGGNPVARWMMDGLAVKHGPDQQIKPDVDKSRVNISGIVAAVMSLSRAILNDAEGPPKESVYEQRGLMTT